MRRLIPVLMPLILSSVSALALGETLSVRPWCEIDPFVRVGPGEYPLSEEEASKRVLEEGRVLFSAMVYGYTFVYTPSDAARSVAESFRLTPVADIPWGVREVRVTETAFEDNKLYARLILSLPDAEVRRRESWGSAGIDAAMGTGEASLFGGYTAKIEALANAIKSAIRNHLSTRVLNKPKEIRGEVVLWEDPVIVIRAGGYLATVTVKLRITEIVPYRIF